MRAIDHRRTVCVIRGVKGADEGADAAECRIGFCGKHPQS